MPEISLGLEAIGERDARNLLGEGVLGERGAQNLLGDGGDERERGA